jgi:hypothetical protein
MADSTGDVGKNEASRRTTPTPREGEMKRAKLHASLHEIRSVPSVDAKTKSDVEMAEPSDKPDAAVSPSITFSEKDIAPGTCFSSHVS